MNSTPMLTLLTIKEAAAKFPGLAAHRIRALIKSGELPSMRAGSKYLVCEQAVVDYITQKCLQPAANADMISAQDTPRR